MYKRILLPLLLLFFTVSAYGQAVTYHVRVHDPVMIKQGDTYYLFCTGPGITVKTSRDRVHWSDGGSVFTPVTLPAWHKEQIPEQDGHLWAPDIHYRDGKYHLYYSVSAWMNFNSGIGYATNVTLDPGDPDYQWVDRGKVIDYRQGGEGVNCIDPNIFVDDDGRVWMLYGSYRAGLRMVELDRESGKLKDEEHPELIVLTTSLGEGVYLIKSNGFYYIFASRGKCCAGVESTYQVVMGRSHRIEGPYLNREGLSWQDNHYTLFMAGDYDQPGRGHNGFFNDRDTTFMVYHAYTRAATPEGASLLSIRPMFIDDEAWPTTDSTQQVLYAPIRE